MGGYFHCLGIYIYQPHPTRKFKYTCSTFHHCDKYSEIFITTHNLNKTSNDCLCCKFQIRVPCSTCTLSYHTCIQGHDPITFNFNRNTDTSLGNDYEFIMQFITISFLCTQHNAKLSSVTIWTYNLMYCSRKVYTKIKLCMLDNALCNCE